MPNGKVTAKERIAMLEKDRDYMTSALEKLHITTKDGFLKLEKVIGDLATELRKERQLETQKLEARIQNLSNHQKKLTTAEFLLGSWKRAVITLFVMSAIFIKESRDWVVENIFKFIL